MMATLVVGVELQPERLFAVQEQDVSPAGIPIAVEWQNVEGATEAQVDAATATIWPAVRTENLGTLTLGTDGDQRVITIPADKRIRSLTLSGFKTDDNAEAVSSADLSARGRRLAVIVQSGGPVPAPQYSVPAIPRRNLMPELLGGASYDNRVLTLPDVAGSRIRLSLVEGDAPEDFQPRAMSLDSVTGVAAILPRDLQLVEPDNSTVAWGFPGEMPAETSLQSSDIRMSVQKLAAAALKNKQPLNFTFKLTSSNTARVGLLFSGARGALLRTFPGVITTKLEGDDARLALDTLASEQPASAIADLTVKYDGLRIHSDLSDVMPAQPGNVSGPIVTDRTVIQPFPPGAFDAIAPARIGVIGRAPEECELSLQFVEMKGEVAGKAIAPPSVVKLEAASRFATHWFELSEIPPPARPSGISVRATRGRFFWAASAKPLVRVAVRDPDPGGRPLTLNETSVLSVQQKETHITAKVLPAAQFRSTAPVLTSDLFLTVDISDLVLRYGR
jgi:hypothetical protein